MVLKLNCYLNSIIIKCMPFLKFLFASNRVFKSNFKNKANSDYFWKKKEDKIFEMLIFLKRSTFFVQLHL